MPGVSIGVSLGNCRAARVLLGPSRWQAPLVACLRLLADLGEHSIEINK